MTKKNLCFISTIMCLTLLVFFGISEGSDTSSLKAIASDARKSFDSEEKDILDEWIDLFQSRERKSKIIESATKRLLKNDPLPACFKSKIVSTCYEYFDLLTGFKGKLKGKINLKKKFWKNIKPYGYELMHPLCRKVMAECGDVLEAKEVPMLLNSVPFLKASKFELFSNIKDYSKCVPKDVVEIFQYPLRNHLSLCSIENALRTLTPVSLVKLLELTMWDLQEMEMITLLDARKGVEGLLKDCNYHLNVYSLLYRYKNLIPNFNDIASGFEPPIVKLTQAFKSECYGPDQLFINIFTTIVTQEYSIHDSLLNLRDGINIETCRTTIRKIMVDKCQLQSLLKDKFTVLKDFASSPFSSLVHSSLDILREISGENEFPYSSDFILDRDGNKKKLSTIKEELKMISQSFLDSNYFIIISKIAKLYFGHAMSRYPEATDEEIETIRDYFIDNRIPLIDHHLIMSLQSAWPDREIVQSVVRDLSEESTTESLFAIFIFNLCQQYFNFAAHSFTVFSIEKEHENTIIAWIEFQIMLQHASNMIGQLTASFVVKCLLPILLRDEFTRILIEEFPNIIIPENVIDYILENDENLQFFQQNRNILHGLSDYSKFKENHFKALNIDFTSIRRGLYTFPPAVLIQFLKTKSISIDDPLSFIDCLSVSKIWNVPAFASYIVPYLRASILIKDSHLSRSRDLSKSLSFTYKSDINYPAGSNEEENVVFFRQDPILQSQLLPEESDVHGKFISSTDPLKVSHRYNMDCLNECSNFVHALLDLTSAELIQSRKVEFINVFKGLVSKNEPEKKEQLENTLMNRYCNHAIAACDINDFGGNFIIKLFTEFPKIVKDHMNLFDSLEDYSFLTVDLVEIYYSNPNRLLTPFSLSRLVETVSLPVIVHLLCLWEFDLSVEDAFTVINTWGGIEEFINSVEKDPRSWLLWFQIGSSKPFPMDQMLNDLEESLPNLKLDHYTNLVLAFIWQSEALIDDYMNQLEYQYVFLHKNDPIQEEFMTPEMIDDLEARKQKIWYESGTRYHDSITFVMSCKKSLAGKLKTFAKTDDSLTEKELNDQILLSSLIELLSIPIIPFNRGTYLKSRIDEEIHAAQENYNPIWSGTTPFPRIENLRDQNYWTVLWKQLEVFDIELAYDETLTSRYNENQEVWFTINNLALMIRKHQTSTKKPLNISNASKLLLLAFASTNEDVNSSKTFVSILNSLNFIHPIDIPPHQINFLEYFLHSEVHEQLLKYKVKCFITDAYITAPEILTREQIQYLLGNEDIRETIIKAYPQNIMKLKYLQDFSASDFKKFFTPGGILHLETHDALYTACPLAIAAYFKESFFACNFPEQLVWDVHPRAYRNLEFNDVIAEIIPFSVFIKNPDDCDSLNFPEIISDIMGRISRNPEENPLKLIIRWLLNFEWLYFQFANDFLLETTANSSKTHSITQFEKILKSFLNNKIILTEWLKSSRCTVKSEEKENILRIIEWVPLSYSRAFDNYEYFLIDKVGSEAERKTRENLKDRYANYGYFSSKSASKLNIRELEKAVSDSSALCSEIIQNNFEIVEKRILSYRLKIILIPTIMKFSNHPISTRFVFHALNHHTMLFADMQIFFYYLCLQGAVVSSELQDDEIEFLRQLPQSVASLGKFVECSENFVAESRKKLLKMDLENAKVTLAREKRL